MPNPSILNSLVLGSKSGPSRTQRFKNVALASPIMKPLKGTWSVLFLVLLMLGLTISLRAQNDEPFCDPGFEGMPRPKFFELSYDRMVDYGISSENHRDPRLSYQGNIRRNAKWESKMRLPLLRSEKLQMSTTLQYQTESLALTPSIGNSESNFIENIGGNTFHKVGATVYAQRPFRGNRFLTLRFKGSLNYEDIANDDLLRTAFRHTVVALYGIKKSPTKRIQFGLAYSYSFGRASVYPLVSYEKVFSSGTRLRVILPALVHVGKDLNSKTRLIFRSELDGANYKVDLGGIGLTGPYVLERSDLKIHVGIERELHDWLWFALRTGVDYNIGFSLVSNHLLDRGEVIVDNNVSPAFFAKATLFIVPPQKLWDRKR